MAGNRCLLGVTGPPGVGKSTFAAAIAEEGAAAGRTVAVVGLDGFHLDDATLVERGLSDVKGAPDTFDVGGFIALLHRLRHFGDADPVRAPGFDRDREQTVPGAVTVPETTELVVVEGNYLLCDGPWRPVRDLLDATWFLELADDVRVSRLVSRHVAHGRTPEQAWQWVRRTDEANARRIDRTRHRADALVDMASRHVVLPTCAGRRTGLGIFLQVS